MNSSRCLFRGTALHFCLKFKAIRVIVYTKQKRRHTNGRRLDGSSLSTCLVVPFITQLNVHKRLTSVKLIKVLLTLWARRLRFFEPRYSVIFSKWGTLAGVQSRNEIDFVSFFSLEKDHTRSRKGCQRFLQLYIFFFLYIQRFREVSLEANRMNDTIRVKFFNLSNEENHAGLTRNRILSSAGWLACHTSLLRVTLCIMIVSLAGEWLFVTIIRMETVENDFDIPRRCYLTLSLGEERVTQYSWNPRVPWYRYPSLPTLFHD